MEEMIGNASLHDTTIATGVATDKVIASCELRKIVFGWTEVQFPFRVRSGRKLKFRQPLIITLLAKPFSTSATHPQITQTGEPTLKATLRGRFIR